MLLLFYSLPFYSSALLLFCSSAVALSYSSALLLFYSSALLLFCSSTLLLFYSLPFYSSALLLFCSPTLLLFYCCSLLLFCPSALLLSFSSFVLHFFSSTLLEDGPVWEVKWAMIYRVIWWSLVWVDENSCELMNSCVGWWTLVWVEEVGDGSAWSLLSRGTRTVPVLPDYPPTRRREGIYKISFFPFSDPTKKRKSSNSGKGGGL